MAITLFVFAMMVVVEYVNLRLEGRLSERMGRRALSQSVWGSAFGLVPGCLGSFIAVTLYEHGALRFGGLLSCMVATTGDEAFLMMAMIPHAFLKVSAVLVVLALVLGSAWDRIVGVWPWRSSEICQEMVFHDHGKERTGHSLRQKLKSNLFLGGLSRWAVLCGLFMYGLLVAAGILDPEEEIWVKAMILGVVVLGLLATAFAEEHFLREHLWGHVVQRHLPKIFLWILGTLVVLNTANQFVAVKGLLASNPWAVLGIAALVGLIPQSGPHFVFITLFAQGAIPFSVLFLNSLVQDGHGGLPLLAFDRRAFLVEKGLKLLVGAILGAVLMALGM